MPSVLLGLCGNSAWSSAAFALAPILATAETTNTQRYREVLWLMSQSSANRSQRKFPNNRENTGNTLKIWPEWRDWSAFFLR